MSGASSKLPGKNPQDYKNSHLRVGGVFLRKHNLALGLVVYATWRFHRTNENDNAPRELDIHIQSEVRRFETLRIDAF